MGNGWEYWVANNRARLTDHALEVEPGRHHSYFRRLQVDGVTMSWRYPAIYPNGSRFPVDFW
jgi:hypothetical protein